MFYELFQEKRILCIEVHPDDIAFSLGGLLQEEYLNDVTILNVFSRSSFCYDKQLAKDAEQDVTIKRKDEEMHFCNLINAKYIFLDFPDSSLRGYTDFFTSNTKERALKKNIYVAIESILLQKEFDVVLYPLGLGGHIDHLIVAEVANELKAKNTNFIFWGYEDLPYAGEINNIDFVLNLKKRGYIPLIYEFEKSAWKEKINCIRSFESQICEHDILVCKAYAVSLSNNGKYAERIWRNNV